MRSLMRLGVAFAAVLAVSACAVASASAADPLFLFEKAGFKISAGEGELQTLGAFLTIKCKSAKGEGKTGGNDTDTFSGTIDYEGCASLGSAVNSEGDASGVILQKFTGELCWINEKELQVGAFIETSEANRVHILLPFGILDLLWGSQIGSVTPINTATTDIHLALANASGGTGDQAVASCVGLAGTRTPKINVIENETGTVKDGAIVNNSFLLTTEVSGKVDG
jgi:hypothetical protein